MSRRAVFSDGLLLDPLDRPVANARSNSSRKRPCGYLCQNFEYVSADGGLAGYALSPTSRWRFHVTIVIAIDDVERDRQRIEYRLGEFAVLFLACEIDVSIRRFVMPT